MLNDLILFDIFRVIFSILADNQIFTSIFIEICFLQIF